MNAYTRLFLILLTAFCVGVTGGLSGIGGGALLVPLLVLAFGFDQHRAQGTSLVALVPPTGLLAFLNYARAGEVNWTIGLLIMAGTRLAQRLSTEGLRRAVAVVVFAIGLWEVSSVWRR